MKIGTRLRRLRLEKDARLGALAEYLHVDARDIDDWEQDRSLPPTELLPKLATFFETTTDELLCMDSYFDDGYQREIISEYGRLIADNHISQAADKMRAAVRAHPKNWQFKVMLQYALYLLCDQPNMARYYSSELKQLHDEIIAGCPDDGIRTESRRYYALHLWNDLGAGEEAESEIMKLPPRAESRENMLPAVTGGERKCALLKDNIFDAVLDASRDIIDLLESDAGEDAESAAVARIRAAADVVSSVAGDGDMGTLAAPICRALLRLAEHYSVSGEKAKAVTAFDLAVDRAVYFDGLPDVYTYTSPMLSGVTRRRADMEPKPLTPYIGGEVLSRPWAQALSYEPGMAEACEKLGRAAERIKAAAEADRRAREERINARAAEKSRAPASADRILPDAPSSTESPAAENEKKENTEDE